MSSPMRNCVLIAKKIAIKAQIDNSVVDASHGRQTNCGSE